MSEEQGGGKPRKKKKNDGAEMQPEVSRVEVEEVINVILVFYFFAKALKKINYQNKGII